MGTRRHGHRADPAGAGSASDVAAEYFATALYAYRAGDGATAHRVIAALAAEPEHEVATAVAGRVEQHVAAAWTRGWQPADLARCVARNLGKADARLIRQAIAGQANAYASLGDRVAPHWMSQVESLDVRPIPDPRSPWLLQLAGVWVDVLRSAVRVMSLLLNLPAVPQLTDPPDTWHAGGRGVRAASLPAGVLEKVRALLAKAEATTFESEADAFTAKAQELMARHRIDRAVLAAGARGGGDQPIGRRIGVDDPYADAKAMLLDAVAGANGCRAVWSRGLGFMTVFGFEDEFGAVEELFTSLLVQATGALRREGSKRDHLGRSRTKRFRRSFLVAFAVRIGERLRDAVDATVRTAAAAIGTALVPILAAREEMTAAAVEEVFPDMGSFGPAATDPEGWHAGRLFGDQASLAVGPQLTASNR